MLITVSRVRTIESLKSHRDRHEKRYNAAADAYLAVLREKAKQVFDSAVRSLSWSSVSLRERINKEGKDLLPSMDDIAVLFDKVELLVRVPRSHLECYDERIEMLSAGVEDTIELNELELSAFLSDKWAWSGEFDEVCNLYGVPADGTS